jgi:DNA-binding beta-propeller fold protein YncE
LTKGLAMKAIRRNTFAASAIVATLVAVAAPAQASWDQPLPLPALGALLVDQAHQHVFVSGGPTANTVVVADFFGGTVEKVDGEFGATGMVLGADGHTVYVALAAGDAISAIDTGTLTETARFATGAQTCPTRMTRTGQSIWFGYGCGQSWNGGVGRLDTAATPPAVALSQQGSARFQGAPLVTSATGPVAAAQPRLSLSTVDIFQVVDGALRPGASGDVAGSNLADVTISPDGTTLFTAAGSQDHVSAFATTDLSGRGAYPTGHYPNAVAASSDSQFLATGTFSSQDSVLVFRIGETTPVRAISLGANVTLADRGLAWSADDRQLFLVVQRGNNPSPILREVLRPAG